MRFSMSWLKLFLTTTATPEAIAEKLTDLGLEVESMVDEGKEYAPFKVVRVMEVSPHPDADKLNVCGVDQGDGVLLQIVCGAPNVRVGMLAALAPVGVTLPGSTIKMKAAHIRGVESFGMLCSAKELGLGGDGSGILDLDGGTPGQSLGDLDGFSKSVFEVSITPNRADCMGVYGIARDLAAGGLGVLKDLPVGDSEIEAMHTKVGGLRVSVDLGLTPSACPEFRACGMSDVRNGESPEWLKAFLEVAGLEPISALVDITNFISLSFARPMHVYDLDKIKGGLTVRFAAENEIFSALNGKTYQLTPDMVVIADEDSVCSLGGIMGGMDSRCTSETQSILIECALFDATLIGKTGQKLKIISDARSRLERGVDPQSTLFGLSYGVRLIKEICGGSVSFLESYGGVSRAPLVLSWDDEVFVQKTGVSLQEGEGLSILKRLGFIHKGGREIEVPSWRLDVSLLEDLIEEVIRIKGYDSIPLKELGSFSTRESRSEGEAQRKLFHTKHVLAHSGLNEVITYAFIHPKEAALFGDLDERRYLDNPLSPELSVMRPSLLPGLIKVLEKNNTHGIGDVGVFEMGSIFFPREGITEEKSVAGVLRGMANPLNWRGPSRNYDFLDAKERAFKMIRAWDIDERALEIDRSELPSWLHPKESGRIYGKGEKNRGKNLGYFGTLHPQVIQALDLSKREPIACFEINLDRLGRLRNKKDGGSFCPSAFPKVTRDFSFLMNAHKDIGPLLEKIKKVDGSLIEKVIVFDIYQGKNIDSSKKAVAFRVWISSMEKTLTDHEITDLCTRISSVCEQEGLLLRA